MTPRPVVSLLCLPVSLSPGLSLCACPFVGLSACRPVCVTLLAAFLGCCHRFGLSPRLSSSPTQVPPRGRVGVSSSTPARCLQSVRLHLCLFSFCVCVFFLFGVLLPRAFPHPSYAYAFLIGTPSPFSSVLTVSFSLFFFASVSFVVVVVVCLFVFICFFFHACACVRALGLDLSAWACAWGGRTLAGTPSFPTPTSCSAWEWTPRGSRSDTSRPTVGSCTPSSRPPRVRSWRTGPSALTPVSENSRRGSCRCCSGG